MAKRTQPPWHVEALKETPPLRLFNSLTRKKEVFLPKNGKQVQWYSCGPTVYDAAHMGHARSYISFDILRRVLSEYFGYNVMYVMNITDIDDKIIRRARKEYFYKQYIAESSEKPLEKILEDTKSSLEHLVQKVQNASDPSMRQMLDKLADDIGVAIDKVQKSIEQNDPSILRSSIQEMLVLAKDPLGDILDKQLSTTIENNSIFFDLPAYWEQKFHEDMDSLNILRPDVVTRVSEYVPEIIAYIQQIISNGLAYVSNQSVYFNVNVFDSKENHSYAKLVPEAYGDLKSLEEGEGELSEHKEKRSPNDFALWKSSKPGEPAWDSPWGKGRPGWHIECSVMASAICGNSLDIHTGGVDLKFPHHDNEIAQAEAYFDNDCWVRYFLHSGHLTIAGCKMSKSLKNFITIGDALKEYSARQLRFAFLLHSWRDTLDYSKNTMDIALSYEKMFMEFFLNVKDIIQSMNDSRSSDRFLKWNDAEKHLNEIFFATKEAVHYALCDNIDTRTALEKIKECITDCNIYMKGAQVNAHLLKNISLYITSILKIFGVVTEKETIGFSAMKATDSDNTETVLMPYLKVLGEFRDEVRLKAKEAKNISILECCDKLRDDKLPELGVRLEDREGKPSAIKLVDKQILLKEKEERERIKLLKEEEKAKRLAKKAEKEAQKLIDPKIMFIHMKDKYSAWDDDGLPTHDVDGKELSKNSRNKLKKLQMAQEVKYSASQQHSETQVN